jgi:alpha-D-ribose 1-methylphosphonate 5-triphosphate synthase subunit PhnH
MMQVTTMLRLDPIWQADTQQRHFRSVLEAMSRPGQCQPIQAWPVSGPAAMTVLATLLDAEVSLADAHDILRDEDWLMLQAVKTPPASADYILCHAVNSPDFTPKIGTLESPELSATLVMAVDKLGEGEMQLRLSGPGIQDSQTLALSGLERDWFEQRNDWNAVFPLGVDMILVDAMNIAALPRTTKLEII